MADRFYNQPVVNWAMQNFPHPIEVKQRFSSRWARLFIYLLLFSFPVLIVAAMVFLKLAGPASQAPSWWGISLCGGVLMVPAAVIILLGAVTRQTLVRSLDSGGVSSTMGRRFSWSDLYYIDHVSKRSRLGGVTRTIADNQLELVFAGGKAIIPPLIENREQIWNLINSMPVQVKDDGKIRDAKPATPAFDDIARAMGELKAQHDRGE